MSERVNVNEAVLRSLYADGMSIREIAEAIGANKSTVANRIRQLTLPPRPKARSPRNSVAAKPVQHVAAVRMPSIPLEKRADWPDLKDAIHRAKAGPAPMAALGMVAARFRLPVSVVLGEAAR